MVSPTSGLAGRLQAGKQSWPCSEAKAGWPAVDFESVSTLAWLGLTAVWQIAAATAKPPSIPGKSTGCSQLLDKYVRSRGRVCTLICPPQCLSGGRVVTCPWGPGLAPESPHRPWMGQSELRGSHVGVAMWPELCVLGRPPAVCSLPPVPHPCRSEKVSPEGSGMGH